MTAGVRAMAPSVLETHGGKEVIMTREEAAAVNKKKKGYAYVPVFDEPPKVEVPELNGKRTRNGGFRRLESVTTNRQEEASPMLIEGRGLKRKSISVNRDEPRDFQGRGGEQNHGDGGIGVSSKDAEMFDERAERRELRKRLKLELMQITAVKNRVVEKLASGLSQVSGPSHVKLGMGNQGLNGEQDSLGPGVGGSQKLSQHVMYGGESGLSRGAKTVHGQGGQRGGLRQETRQLNTIQVLDTTPGMAGREKRTPKASARLVDFETGNDKRQPAEKKPKGKSGGKKVGHAGTGDGLKRKADEMGPPLEECYKIINRLMAHNLAYPFNVPVDPVALNIPDYFKIIKDPMDFRTIKEKLEAEEYAGPQQFEADMKLVFSNCYLFNARGSDVHRMGETLHKYFDRCYKPIRERIKAEEKAAGGVDAKGSGDREEAEENRRRKPRIQGKEDGNGKSGALKSVKSFGGDSRQPMTFEEKRKLSLNLGKLPSDKLGRIVAIISERNPDFGGNGDEIELDIDSLDNDTLWQLNRYVANCMKSKSKDKKREEQREVQQEPSPQQENLLVEEGRAAEEVVGMEEKQGDVEDTLAFPERKLPSRGAAMDVDKDQGGYGSRSESSSGSSSGESSSSDSDSDSGSSSGSESEPEDIQSADAGSGTPAHPPDKVQMREVGAAGAGRGPSGTSAPKPDSGKRVESPGDGDATSYLKEGAVVSLQEAVVPEPELASVAGPSQPEQAARQPSPEEDLRRKELMGRFANVIAKATVEVELGKQNSFQGQKADPEKMKRDREEKERLERLERERLRREAAKAEEARKKAHAEAQAERERRVEAERQAHRQKLQDMEKTVEIDGGMEVLKEMERLRRNTSFQGPPPEAPASSGEPSPSHSPGDEGGDHIDLQGDTGFSLARLGLVMKDDDDEEAEGDEPGDEDYFSEPEQQAGPGGEVDREEGEL